MSLRSALPVSARPRSRTALRILGSTVGATLAGSVLLAVGPAATAEATTTGQRAVQLAAAQAGDPYVYGAAGPDSFDCSGLVMYVYQRLGIGLPHNSQAQYNAVRHIPKSDAQPGDIVFFYDSSGYVYHDGIYAGGGKMWAAPHSGTVVQMESVYTSHYYIGRPYGSATTTASSGSGGTQSTGYHVGSGHPLLRIGAQGPAVAEAQRLLHVTADGEFGPVTQQAVVRFQRSHGLLADGEIGQHTWAALTAGNAVTVAYHPGSEPVLSLGATGSAVRVVQRAVGTSVDGQFGPLTRTAVVRFQRRHNLVADGVVGAHTWAAIRGSSAV